jgi:hypothetical protein
MSTWLKQRLGLLFGNASASEGSVLVAISGAYDKILFGPTDDDSLALLFK